MKAFSALIEKLEVNKERSAQELLLSSYFRSAKAEDAIWAIALLTGKTPKRSATSGILLSLAAKATGVPPWLAEECSRATEDVAEAAALMFHSPRQLSHQLIDRSLAQCMRELLGITQLSSDHEGSSAESLVSAEIPLAAQNSRHLAILAAWEGLSSSERVVFNRLLCGTFRSPVPTVVCVGPLSEKYGAQRSVVARRLAGMWNPESLSLQDLFNSDSLAVTDPSSPKPFCQYPPLREEPTTLGAADGWFAAHSWGGVPAQLVRRVGESFLWGSSDELLTAKVPDILDEARLLPEGTVVAGELVAFSEGIPQPRHVLDQRLKLKRVSKEVLRRTPVRFIVFDILEYQGQDLTGGRLQDRLSALNDLKAKTEIGQSMRVEESYALGSWDEFSTKLAEARDLGARGLVLRHKDSVYLDSVSKNLSFLAAPNPRFLNAILLYAEKSKYSQDGLFDEFTFAVREDDSLVPVAKISEGISEAELIFLQGWIKSNTKERFGPVRSLEPQLIFRLGYESVVSSTRHRSKIALVGAHVVERLSGPEEVSNIEELRARVFGKNSVSGDSA